MTFVGTTSPRFVPACGTYGQVSGFAVVFAETGFRENVWPEKGIPVG